MVILIILGILVLILICGIIFKAIKMALKVASLFLLLIVIVCVFFLIFPYHMYVLPDAQTLVIVQKNVSETKPDSFVVVEFLGSRAGFSNISLSDNDSLRSYDAVIVVASVQDVCLSSNKSIDIYVQTCVRPVFGKYSFAGYDNIIVKKASFPQWILNQFMSVPVK